MIRHFCKALPCTSFLLPWAFLIMINLIVSLLLAAGTWVLCATCFFDSVWSGCFPAIIVFVLSLAISNKMIAKKVQAIILESQTQMKELGKIQSQETLKRMMPKIMDKTIEILNKAYKYEYFQFSVTQTINAQIGTLYYIQKRFDEAEPYLKNSIFLNGTALGMYACILYKKNDIDGMKKQFKKALRFAQRDVLLWHVYAWCLDQNKDQDGAIEILNQCLIFNAKSDTTKENLNRLKNGQHIDMAPFGEQWYQYMLEQPTAQAIQAMGQGRKLASPFARHVRK